MEIVLLCTEGMSYAEVSGFIGSVPAARRGRILKKANDADKLNALLSELLLTSEITKRTGIPAGKIAFTKGQFGKPYLKDGGLWFSLSHTNGAIAAAFSKTSEIGVDIERCSRKASEKLYERVLCEEEKPLVNSDEDFIRIWVQKEAFLKRLGVGITRSLRGVNTTALPDTAAIKTDGFFIAASGAGAANMTVSKITPKELLEKYIKIN